MTEAKGQVVKAVKETATGMGTGRDREKLQDSLVESAEVKGKKVAAEKEVGTGAGSDEEPQRIASRLYASAASK